jgi:glycosyltransferase involved in cell wall biosynthesis
MLNSIVLYIFLGSLAVQMVYYIFKFSRLPFYRKKPASPNPQPVSVVICAHDEEENLRTLLPALFKQEHPDFEIVVVNDRSNDNTYDLLLGLSHAHHNLKIVQVEKVPADINSKKYGLTLGIKAAKNDIILLTDADCIPNSANWVSAMSNHFDENTQIVIGYSQYIKTKSILNQFIRFETLYTGLQYITSALSGNPYMGVGRNLAYRKSFFLQKKGFNHLKVTGGDDDLFVNEYANKKNTKVAIGDDCLMYSLPKKNISSYYKQKKRHLYAGKYYKLKDKIRLAFLSLSHILFWISFITLAILGFEPSYLGIGLAVRMATMYLIFHISAKKLGDKFKVLAIPFLDLIYVLYYIRTGLAAFTAKKIKWN